ncbi:30S ribosome-binding factor RbfA [Rubritalea spongiae]|uniref:Ribosome-binding factor A n=1 Tax=Rubritalea spongiae TaxID=430797 RepID=A0ABW5E4H3_9BACT
MSQRLDKINELLKREISSFVQKEFEFKNALVTISDVQITDDLREGKVFVSVLGGNTDSVLEKLTQQKGAIQRFINKRTNLRCTPVLMFREDTSAERGVDMVNLLDEVAQLPTAPPEEEDEK